VDYGGFSPMEAIEAGTRVSARVLGLENDLGTIEEGKIADLILVGGNPLENIDILLERESIRLVMQGGNIARNDLT
jgi:imidazolonepropionase-like amidohydrolase